MIAEVTTIARPLAMRKTYKTMQYIDNENVKQFKRENHRPNLFTQQQTKHNTNYSNKRQRP